MKLRLLIIICIIFIFLPSCIKQDKISDENLSSDVNENIKNFRPVKIIITMETDYSFNWASYDKIDVSYEKITGGYNESEDTYYDYLIKENYTKDLTIEQSSLLLEYFNKIETFTESEISSPIYIECEPYYDNVKKYGSFKVDDENLNNFIHLLFGYSGIDS